MFPDGFQQTKLMDINATAACISVIIQTQWGEILLSCFYSTLYSKVLLQPHFF